MEGRATNWNRSSKSNRVEQKIIGEDFKSGQKVSSS